MGILTLADEAGAPGTPADGASVYSVAGVLKYKNDGGTAHTLVTNADIAGINGGASATDQVLKEWTTGEDYEITAATLDSDGVPTTATVKWPDGSAGTFTTTTKNSTWLAVDAYTISHTTSGKTVTQTAVTRDSNGQVTAKPSLTVA